MTGRDGAFHRPLSDALASAGMLVQRMVARVCAGEEVVSRADAEGGVPIVATWDACGDGVGLVIEMLEYDPLPARPYVLVVPDDVAAAIAAEQLEELAPDDVERVLVVIASELATGDLRELLRLHLSRRSGPPLGRARSSGVTAAPVTDFPGGERVIADIDRRALLRGTFHVAQLKAPRI